MQAALDQSGAFGVASVNVVDCQNGYARVFAIPQGDNQQSEQVYLIDVEGIWQVLEIGTGVECSDPSNLSEAVRVACEALGLLP